MENKYRDLKRENELLSDELSNADWKEIKKLLYAMNASKMGMYDIEIVKRDIIHMALKAEKRGECLKDVIGDGEQEFCMNLVKSAGKASWKEILLFEFYQISIAWLIFMIVILFNQTSGMMPKALQSGDPGMIVISISMIEAWLIGNVILVLLDRFLENKFIFDKGFRRHISTFVIVLFLIVYFIVVIKVMRLQSVTFEVYWAILPGIFVPLVIMAKWMFENHMRKEAEKHK